MPWLNPRDRPGPGCGCGAFILSRNSRIRDFFDVHALAERCKFDGERLVGAVRGTFERRKTPFPDTTPLALTPQFAEVDGKPRQWNAFLERNRIDAPAETLDAVVEGIATFLVPVLSAARADLSFAETWPAGGPWQRAVNLNHGTEAGG